MAMRILGIRLQRRKTRIIYEAMGVDVENKFETFLETFLFEIKAEECYVLFLPIYTFMTRTPLCSSSSESKGSSSSLSSLTGQTSCPFLIKSPRVFVRFGVLQLLPLLVGEIL